MSFIGIISEGKNEGYLNKIISSKLNKSTVININEKSIENIKNVRFETLLITGNNKKILDKTEVLKSILTNVKYLIINADIETNLSILDNLNLTVITFGFNAKCTITTSSINEDNILLCIQRTIKTIQEIEIEPQEILVKIKENMINAHSVMGAATLLIIYGIEDLIL